MPHLNDFSHLWQQLHLASAQHTRRLCVLHGSFSSTHQIATKIAKHFNQGANLVLGHTIENCQSDEIQKATRYLGQSFQWVIYDAFAGFHPNSFAAIAGTVQGGGLLLLLTPPLSSWEQYADPDYQRINVYPGFAFTHKRFLQWLVQQLSCDPDVLIYATEQCALDSITPSPHSTAHAVHALTTLSYGAVTLDQVKAVQQILDCANSITPYPLVITADRGRGKSTALGLACAALLMQDSPKRIVISAPSPQAVQTLFSAISYPNTDRITFIAPDELLRNKPPLDLLLIDEAAALPLSMLQALLFQYPRIIFASTVQGYEGSGRGFYLRFNAHLAQHHPNWQSLTLTQAIRYATPDPVEQFCLNALLLETEESEPPVILLDLAHCQFHHVSADHLIKQPKLLSTCFGLLVQAHYQTTPDDLRLLLDGPGVDLFTLSQDGNILAVLLSIAEGGLEQELALSISQGQRRVRGHLIPQSMANHAGFTQLCPLRGRRISRIVVNPQYQNQGLGSLMLQAFIQWSAQQGDDYIATSFAASASLLRFWQKQQWVTWRIGHQRDQCSGQHSFIMGLALNAKTQAISALFQQRLHTQLPYQLSHWLSDLDYALVEQLGRESALETRVAMSEHDWMDIDHFIHHHRQFDYCMPILQQWVYHRRNIWCQPHWQTARTRHLLIAKLLLNQSWQTIQTHFQLHGLKAAQQALKQALKALRITEAK